jgi:uncharacterized protein YndB with AHSA1/START domain
MTVTNVQQDPENRTLTMTAEFDAAPEAVWDLWADPRRLERWWGPPTWPATVTEHDLVPGGRVSYHMTGPEGEKAAGYWKVLSVTPPHGLEFDDGFANSDGTPDDSLPVSRGKVDIAARDGGGTTMTVRTTFASREAMEQVIGMGVIEGMTAAMGQMDALLAGATA